LKSTGWTAFLFAFTARRRPWPIKFRNKIGLDTVIEALRFYRERRKIKVEE